MFKKRDSKQLQLKKEGLQSVYFDEREELFLNENILHIDKLRAEHSYYSRAIFKKNFYYNVFETQTQYLVERF